MCECSTVAVGERRSCCLYRPRWPGQASPGAAARPVTVGNASLSAKAAAGAFSAAKLRGALLTRVNGVGAATPVASGDFSSLSAAETGELSAGDVKATPEDCAQATQTGFDPTVLAGSPAAAVTFKVDANGVSEVLVSSSDSVASTVLAGRLPAACAHFKETVNGKTLTYTATESALTGIGQQARMLNVHSSGRQRGRPVVARLPGQGVRRRGDRGRP